MARSSIAVLALLALAANGARAAAQDNRYAAVTKAAAPVRVTAHPRDEEVATRIRRALAHIALAQAVPIAAPTLPSGPFAAAQLPLAPPCAARGRAPDSVSAKEPPQEEAVRHFSAAAECGAEGFDLVLGLATVERSLPRRLRALFGAERGTCRTPTPRTFALLLPMVREADPVATVATSLLERTAGVATAPDLAPLVDDVLRNWPANRATLRLTLGAPDHCTGQRHWMPANVPSRLVLIASRSGDRHLLDRLLQRPTLRDPDHVDFVLRCLTAAAPNVDADTARLLFDLFLPNLAEVDPNGVREALPRREREVLDLFAALYPIVPEDRLPPLHALFDRPNVRNALLAEQPEHEPRTVSPSPASDGGSNRR